MKKVLVISTACHNESNSHLLAESFAQGAKEAGNEVELVSLNGKTINPCHGCYGCAENNHKCIYNDDAPAIVEKIKNADVIVWATPVYFYEMTGQMKTLIDRTVALYGTNPNFKDVYLLIAAGEDDPKIKGRIEAGLNGWIECYPGSRLAGTVMAGGVHGPNAAKGHPAVQEAYNVGKNC